MRTSCLMAAVLGSIMLLTVSVESAPAALVTFQFNGTQTGNPSATVQALLGIDSSLVVPNGSFTQVNLQSFSVQYNGTFTASSSAIPVGLAGQFNGAASAFSALSSNQSLTIPAYTGTNSFFYGDGQSWQFAGSGSVTPSAAPFNFIGTGTWSLTPVPVPAAMWLFGSGLAGVIGYARRRVEGTSII